MRTRPRVRIFEPFQPQERRTCHFARLLRVPFSQSENEHELYLAQKRPSLRSWSKRLR